ncbi:MULTISPECIES: immunoglobulin-like domain-containing protein [unclassified Shewanella]|uniref:immunoglobulin-like domain-containing protein n=1 Tax=unclassified Shewanella TaxID=196818 RepID=UPI001BB8873E|nr:MULTISPECIES: immunoglobulin-like domain-containing protein [unclassified Shewanella]GIU05598.1 hypothetical protein TUM4444_02200 [Shewanella sp. MBTL60-112-B1]GIU23804.1 hypothetical protein TUM4445_00170 [Shewanella sp. MBTL60-112-B2]
MNYKPNTMYAALSFSLLTLTACGGGDSSEAGDMIDIDALAPVIKLNGESPMLVAHGAEFSDPGASVSDNVDTNLAISASGTVDTNTVGSYTLTYSASDSAGNSAQIFRVVNVTDQTSPEIALMGEAELRLEQNSTFTEPGSMVSDNVDQELVAVVSGSVDLSTVGNYTLTYDAKDAAGNAAQSVQRTIIVTPITGQLSDILVSGLAYTTATQSGVTDKEGNFLYQEGEDIQFSLGDTLIGDAATAKKSLSLMDLLPNATLYTTYGQLKNLDKLPEYHPDVVSFYRLNNTLTLLHSVDADSNPDNGIDIPAGLLSMFTGVEVDLQRHFYYLAGKRRRFGEGDKQLKRILQPAAAQGLLDKGDIVGHGIALDSYYRLNNISHNLQIQTGSRVDIDADGNIDGVNEEYYSELGDRTRSVEDNDNDGVTDYIANYGFDKSGRRVSYSFDNNGDGAVERHGYYLYDTNGNQIMFESDSDADGVIDSRFTEEYDAFGNTIGYSHDSDADGLQDSISAYTYDVKGNLLSQSYDQDGDGQVDEISDSTFDSKGNRLSSTDYSGDDRTKITSHHEYSYDQRNNMTSSRADWDGDGHVDSSESTTYDLNDNQLVSERDNDGDGSIDWRYRYSYDEYGNQNFASFEEVGVNTGLYYYTFDDKANRLSHDGDDDGDGTIDYRYSSTFDTDGNRLTRVYDFDNDGMPEEVNTYTYNRLGNRLTESRDENGDGSTDEIITYTLAPANFRAVINDIF